MSEILSGIYKIYCKDTNKYYIGQSVNVKNRLNQHLSELKNNKHINQELQEDFNSCGEDAFIFEKIKDVEEEFLNIFEKYYMEYYNSLEGGYNVMPMNNLVRSKDKHMAKKENLINYFENIDYIEVPIYTYDICMLDAINTLYFASIDAGIDGVEKDMEEFIDNTFDYIQDCSYELNERITKCIELEVRRKFSNAGISDVWIYEEIDINRLIKDGIFEICIQYKPYRENGKVEEVVIKAKCTKQKRNPLK